MLNQLPQRGGDISVMSETDFDFLGTNKHLILQDKNIEDNLIKKVFIGMQLTNLLMREVHISLLL